MRDKDDDNEKQILILVSLKGDDIVEEEGEKRLGHHFLDTVHSLVLQRFRLYLTTFRGKGVVPRTVA